MCQSSIFVAFTALLSLASTSPIENNKLAPIHPQIKLIATVDGKSFFAEKEPTRSWHNAKLYCESMGLKLASITTVEQANALNSVAGLSDFNTYFWTSGRDAQEHRQFSWDMSSPVPVTGVVRFGHFSPIATCVLLNAISNNNIILEGILCSREFGTLCET